MSPAWWESACAELSARDREMESLIARFPDSRLTTRGAPYETLLRAIVGQQISTRAADAIWARVVATAGAITPEAVQAAGVDALRVAGLSQRKAEYVLEMSAQVADGRLDPPRLAELDDQALLELLTGLRGIGRWTAEMFLIFNLNRPDVWPIDDIGIKKALVQQGWAPSLELPRRQWDELGERWRPWRTVVSWYLWRSLDPVDIVY
jgi:DNA-3-methyladenine glycosylase II